MLNWLSKYSADAIVLRQADKTWGKEAILQTVSALVASLRSRLEPYAPVGILGDNHPEWLMIDWACQEAGVALIPLPTFFTPSQWVHTIRQSGMTSLFVQDPQHAKALGFVFPITAPSQSYHLFEASQVLKDQIQKPDLLGIQKVTFTSGTTAEPKGVCLSAEQQWAVAQSLEQQLRSSGIERHLTLLPLSVLLENIAGAYTAALSAASNIVPALQEVGLLGASQFNPELCLNAIEKYQAQSVILLPQMLQALLAVLKKNDPRLASLRFMAVGGAKVPEALLHAAQEMGLPIFEGYGLSECCSVVTLNLPQASRIGSIGRALPHHQLTLATDGEILVKATAPLRYLGQAEQDHEWIATGDLGHQDADGYWYISGRKKNVLITSFGRNVSPEWPESILLGSHCFAQAMVLGDGQPYLSAILLPYPGIDGNSIEKALEQVNAQLPDYAQIRAYCIAREPFTLSNGLATANGRPKRAAILQSYATQIQALYAQDLNTSQLNLVGGNS